MIAVQNTGGREPLQRPDRKSLAHVQGCQKTPCTMEARISTLPVKLAFSADARAGRGVG